ncbi:hypothetical protein E2C01_042031 [Portunus trituberculatus]|uniref:Uncharacterized protein n=1 Tax=Portunus trituberculatus TaxID=210409 RepID=A0A5B7FTH8_PORTR|nr:hypothetical protein [Portunus trituberculatus]
MKVVVVVVVLVMMTFLNFITASRYENQTIEERDVAKVSLSDAHETGEGDDLSDEAKQRVVEGMVFNPEEFRGEVVFGNLNLPNDLQESTLCFWIKHYRAEIYVNLITNQNVQIFLHMYNMHLFKTSYHTIVIPKIELRVWMHFCVVIHDQGFDAYMNGRLAEQGRDQPVFYGDQMNAVLAGNVPLVISTNSTIYYFSGILADLKLFPKKLTQTEADDVRTGAWRGINYYTMTIDKILTTNSGLDIIRNITYEDIFQRPADYIILSFYESETYPRALRLCQAYGGLLPNKDTDDISAILRKCKINNGHSSDIWIHTSHYDPHSPNASCLMITQYLQSNASLIPWSCNDESSCICCYVPRNTRVRMTSGDQLMEQMFYFIQPSVAGQKVILEGEKTLHVAWKNSSSVAVMTKNREVVFRQQPATNHYMGRSLWSATSGGNLNISFSVCKKDQFSCSTGECVSILKRCDGVPADCSDNSDEAMCENFYGPPPSYYPQNAPSDPRINVTLYVKYVRNVDTDRNRLEASHPSLLTIFSVSGQRRLTSSFTQIVMEVNLAWRDERLTFYNLRSSAGLPNILDNDILSLLWVPGIYFPSGLFEENLNLETGTMTHTTVTAVPGRNGSLTTLNSYESKFRIQKCFALTTTIFKSFNDD